MCTVFESLTFMRMGTLRLSDVSELYDQNSSPHVEVLIAYQDSSNGDIFSPGVYAVNKNLNTLATTFSALDEMESFRLANGSFWFKMCYPGKDKVHIDFFGKMVQKQFF